MKQHIRVATFDDVKAIHAMMKTAEESVEHPDYFCADNREFIEQHITSEGFTLLWEEDGVPGAFLIVRIPGKAADNLGIDLELPSDRLDYVAHMETTVVSLPFRGRGIQRLLMTEAERRLILKGYLYCLGTVHPNNAASLATFQNLNYSVALTKEKYGGKLRYIMRKDLLPKS